MSLMFSKMHGLGNDFMVIDGITQDVTLEPERIRAWADRHFGIGFDQLLLVEPPRSPVVDFRYRVFNADGSEVSQCGNGARCFAVFVRRKGLTSERRIRVETADGRMVLTVLPNEEVEVDMGVPRLKPEQVPLQLPEGVAAETTHLRLPLSSGEQLDAVALSMGNPHVVSFHDELTDGLVATLGPELERHPWFPERANAGFLQILDRETARLRVYERGAGETLACGSGACAAFVAAVLRGRMASRATLHLTGGTLTLGWDGPGTPVMMTGPAAHVFDGTLEEGSDVL